MRSSDIGIIFLVLEKKDKVIVSRNPVHNPLEGFLIECLLSWIPYAGGFRRRIAILAFFCGWSLMVKSYRGAL
jgi:uncharacterized membrane protein